ncbi:MAG: tripartite tricarboxylate transporter TctB family protein [Acidobacteria bacterium]|nr:tripartite tricarboxylate transporter TctB family protein [Acidobacteriota bacterium]
MLAAIVTHQSAVTLDDVTPIARLIGEYEVIVVPTDSPFGSLHDLVEAFKRRPESIAWGGGSAGGTDQILAGLMADAVGVAPTRVNYVAFSGGGDMLAALLGKNLAVGVNGFQEMQPQIAAGALRALAISSATRVPGIDVPTLREQGVGVELINWRSVVAPPGISAAERGRLTSAMEAMVQSPEWHALLERYHWIDLFLAGPELERFIAAEDARVATILEKLGTAGGPTATWAAAMGYPLLILAGLVVTGIAAAIELVRPSRRSPPTTPSARWSSAAWIAAGMALDVALLEPAGFVVASAILFWCAARAFETSRPYRDAAFALGTSVACYLLFVRVLKLSLPAGMLERWL